VGCLAIERCAEEVGPIERKAASLAGFDSTPIPVFCILGHPCRVAGGWGAVPTSRLSSTGGVVFQGGDMLMGRLCIQNQDPTWVCKSGGARRKKSTTTAAWMWKFSPNLRHETVRCLSEESGGTSVHDGYMGQMWLFVVLLCSVTVDGAERMGVPGGGGFYLTDGTLWMVALHGVG